MSREQFRREKLYQVTMSIVRSLLRQGLISEDDYCEIDTILTAKYAPAFGGLFFNIDLQ